jgi:predicted amino acid dehydrogenase
VPWGSIEWDTLAAEPDLEHIAARIVTALTNYDAVALEGIFASFNIAGHVYRHHYVWKMLGIDQHGDRVSDGSGLQATLERYLVSQAAIELEDAIRHKHILFLSGLNRWGSADVLSRYSERMTFGDMLYGFRLGIPIKSFGAFVKAAGRLARAAGRTPANWYWPSARKSRPLMPRFQRYFRNADVIVGGMSYFRRYMPDSLQGKVIITNIHCEADVELFAERKASVVVSLTPVIDGVYVPLPVLEASFKLTAAACGEINLADYYLSKLQQLDLRPHIINLGARGHEDYALVELPTKATELVEPDAVEEPELSTAGEVSKFCFVIHPLSFKDIARLKVVRAMQSFLPRRLIEDAAAQFNPWPIGVLRNVTSATGARAEGLIYAVPMTSKAIMRFPAEFLYKRLLQVAEDASGRGCKLMGLGAYTSVAGDAGVTVSKRSPIGVTTGNSFTVASTLRTLEQAAQRAGIDIATGNLLIVGATGSIGSVCARLAARQVSKLYLASPRPEKLLALARLICKETPQMAGRIELSSDAQSFMPLADGVITTTSAVDPIINVDALKPGCLVLDVARPPDISRQAAVRRDDVLVIESGEVLLPEGAELTCDIGLPPGIIYACLSETLLLALDGRFDNFTLGRDIKPARVDLIAEISDKHGFALAPIRSFGTVVPDERFAALAEINRKRQSRDGSN